MNEQRKPFELINGQVVKKELLTAMYKYTWDIDRRIKAISNLCVTNIITEDRIFLEEQDLSDLEYVISEWKKDKASLV